MKYQWLILIFLFSIAGKTLGQKKITDVARIPLAKYFEPSVYDGGIQNWSFSQDTSGILYVANNYGLLEFDGSTWSHYDVPFSTKIRSVFVDGKNRILVGGAGQIGYFDKSANDLNFIPLLEKLPPAGRSIEEVWKIISHQDKIYFNTSYNLFVLDEEEFYPIALPHEIELIFKIKSKLLVQFVDMGLFVFENNQFTLLKGTDEIKGEINAILQEGEGFLIFSTHGNVHRYSNNTLIKVRTEVQADLNSTTINACIRLSNGNIAIGTQNQGLFILDEEMRLKNHYTKHKGLHNRTVLALLEDDFKNLWVGLNNGINYLELNSPLSLVNEEVGLEGTGYAATIHNGHIYLGTNNGLFIQKEESSKNATFELISGSEGLVNNLSLVDDDLILNHHKGAFLVTNEELTKIHDVGSWKFMSTPKPNIALGGNYDGISFFEKSNNTWDLAYTVDSFNISSRVFEFIGDSTLWMTHGYKGAYKIEFDKDLDRAKKIELFGEDDGFPSNILISVYKLNEKLIFTGSEGIYDFSHQLNAFTPNTFLTDLMGTDHVSKIVSNLNGDLFFLADRQFGYLRQESFGKYNEEQYPFERINELISDDLENISVLDNRNILIGAKDGFIHFDPSHNFDIERQFKVLLRNAEIEFTGDSTITIFGEFLNDTRLEESRSIKFRFAAPYFSGFEDLQYSYRLVGFNDSWSPWSNETVKEYTNLSAGKFSFEVKGRNVYGNESEVLSNTFTILPKWYLSSWAYVSYIFSAIFLFGVYSYFQDKKHRKEKEILYQSKEDAIRSKDEEISQVSKQSKEEIENLRNEKHKSEINHKNNELASATMHLLNKNEFVQGVRKRIEALVNDPGSSREELKRIIKTIDRNLQEDDSWDQFAYHFDQVHGDFLKNITSDEIKLTPQETKLAAYLRMNMSSKEIANLMNISVRGVELARYRLRKKLKLERDQNLIEYLLQV